MELGDNPPDFGGGFEGGKRDFVGARTGLDSQFDMLDAFWHPKSKKGGYAKKAPYEGVMSENSNAARPAPPVTFLNVDNAPLTWEWPLPSH